MALLGIDVGTSFIKGAILDPQGSTLRSISRIPFPSPVAGLPPSFVEVDPRAVMDAVQQLLQSLVRDAAEPLEGLLLCGQMGGVVLVDAAGQLLTNYLSWRDQRTCEASPSGQRPVLDQLRRLLPQQQLAELGNELRPGSSISLLYWLERRQALPRHAIPLSLPAFVVSQLCGSISGEHPTLALSALDLRSGQWHKDVLEQLGLAALRWPEIWTSEPVGFCSLAGSRVPCFAAVGDHPCALRGVGLEEGELSLNISTGSQISRLSPTPQFGNWQIRPYFHAQFLNTITHLPAGRSLDALVSLLTEIPRAQGFTSGDPWSYIRDQAHLVQDDTLHAELSFFAGPMGETGSVTGIRLENLTVGHLFRAAFRHMAENYRQCAERLDPQRTWQRLVFSGGLATRLDLLKSFILEQLPGPYRVCDHQEDTLMGLVALAREEFVA